MVHRQTRGVELLKKLETAARERFGGYMVTSAPADEEGSGEKSHSLALRQGLWRGVDVKLTENADQVDVTVEPASKGATILMVVAVLGAIAIPFTAGDPILQAVGITSIRSNFTIALATIPFLIILVPLAMIAARILGGQGAQDSKQLAQQVQQMAAEQRSGAN